MEVTLECTTPGAKIYYVTDTAKDPAIDGIEFTAPITLTETTTIKAIAKAENMNNSDPLEVTYTKQTPQPPVVDPEPRPDRHSGHHPRGRRLLRHPAGGHHLRNAGRQHLLLCRRFRVQSL